VTNVMYVRVEKKGISRTDRALSDAH
jgi:hypothetical protein